jgi:type I restriction enzyme S subunit
VPGAEPTRFQTHTWHPAGSPVVAKSRGPGFDEEPEFRNGANADKGAYGKGVPFINVLEVITHSHLDGAHIPGRVSLPASVVDLYAVRRGDVLFNRTSETQEEVGLSSVYLGKDKVVFGGFVIRGRPVGALVDAVYSGYGFRAPAIRAQIVARGQGAIRANIGQGELRGVLVPLPPITEQLAIATALSDVDALVASLGRLIAKKCALRRAAADDLLFGRRRLSGFSEEWAGRSLGSLGVAYGGLSGKTKSDFGVGSARYVPFLSVMRGAVLDPDSFERVRVSASEGQNEVAKGDLFFNGSSETPEEVGMCAVLLAEVRDVFLNSFCFGFRLRENAEVSALFLAYLFRSRCGRDLLYSLAQGATRYNLSKSSLLKLVLKLPRLEEQDAIAAVLSDMDAEIAALEARRAKTLALKQAMMHELLTGRTRLV